MHGDADTAGGDLGVFVHVVHVLQNGADAGGLLFVVDDAGGFAVFEGVAFGGVFVEHVALRVAEPLVQGGEDVFVLELAVGDAAVADLLDDQVAVLLADGGDFEIGHPFGKAVHAGDPLLHLVVPVGELQASGDDLGGEQAGGGGFIGLAALAAAFFIAIFAQYWNK